MLYEECKLQNLCGRALTLDHHILSDLSLVTSQERTSANKTNPEYGVQHSNTPRVGGWQCEERETKEILYAIAQSEAMYVSQV